MCAPACQLILQTHTLPSPPPYTPKPLPPKLREEEEEEQEEEDEDEDEEQQLHPTNKDSASFAPFSKLKISFGPLQVNFSELDAFSFFFFFFCCFFFISLSFSY